MKKPGVDRMFKAFADETRLRILHLLSSGELCVCDIMMIVKAPQPKISRHLAYLKSAGLVIDRKEEQWKYYSLSPARSQFQRDLLHCLNSCFTEVQTLQKDSAKLKELRRKGCC
jgi:ArsR family transcriptional regulator